MRVYVRALADSGRRVHRATDYKDPVVALCKAKANCFKIIPFQRLLRQPLIEKLNRDSEGKPQFGRNLREP